MKCYFFFFSSLLFVFSCKNNDSTASIAPKVVVSPKVKDPKALKDSTLLYATKKVLEAAKNNDFAAIATYIKPSEGLRFSPYSFIDITGDKKFSSEDFLKSANSATKIKWGAYDATGEPILLSTKDYFKKFVYTKDYLTADTMRINQVIAQGNATNNIAEIYKNADFVECYIAGKDPNMAGMDWRAIRLVFVTEQEKIYLVAIINNQWTS